MIKMKIRDVCLLIDLFEATPLSLWDVQQGAFTNISPSDTYKFYELAASTKQAGFNAAVLEYILQGTLPAESTLGLDPRDRPERGHVVEARIDAHLVEDQHAGLAGRSGRPTWLVSKPPADRHLDSHEQERPLS